MDFYEYGCYFKMNLNYNPIDESKNIVEINFTSKEGLF
jgi:hypothetical protein